VNFGPPFRGAQIFDRGYFAQFLEGDVLARTVTKSTDVSVSVTGQGYGYRYITYTRMWANAQRDGRAAEYRWRPLFNAAKFG